MTDPDVIAFACPQQSSRERAGLLLSMQSGRRPTRTRLPQGEGGSIRMIDSTGYRRVGHGLDPSTTKGPDAEAPRPPSRPLPEGTGEKSPPSSSTPGRDGRQTAAPQSQTARDQSLPPLRDLSRPRAARGSRPRQAVSSCPWRSSASRSSSHQHERRRPSAVAAGRSRSEPLVAAPIRSADSGRARAHPATAARPERERG
jgi:hypothetical protein